MLCLYFADAVDDFVNCCDAGDEMLGRAWNVVGLLLEDEC